MKAIFINIILLTAVSISAQTEVDFLNAIGNDKLEKLNAHLADNVILCINDNQEKVDKTLAIQKIKDFLKRKKIVRFKILHNGKSADKRSSYRVARLKTPGGTYRIFAYSEKSGNTSKVVEVRIDAM